MLFIMLSNITKTIMSNLYSSKFLKITLKSLRTEIVDLEKWSVANEDVLLDKILELKKQFDEINKIIFNHLKDGDL